MTREELEIVLSGDCYTESYRLVAYAMLKVV